MTREDIFAAIVKEHERQAALWHSSHDWGSGDWPVKVAVLTEELGEVAKAMLDNKPADIRHELIQLAAVCVAWLEAL